MKLKRSPPAAFLAAAACILGLFSTAWAGENNGTKTRTYGNKFLGLGGTARFMSENSTDSEQYAEMRASAKLQFLGLSRDIADTRIKGRVSTKGSTSMKLLGKTVWSKTFSGSTGRLTSPDMTRSVFGGSPPKYKVGLGPFTVTLKGNAGVGSDADFYYHIVVGNPRVTLDGWPRVWAFASGRVSVSCLVAEIGINLEETFAKTRMDGDIDVRPTGIKGSAHAKYSDSHLKIRIYFEVFGFDVYVKTLVDTKSGAKSYDIW